jgi:uncharacterized iron-regulated membrane protein
MRRLILNLHLAIGLGAGLFVIVLGGTGSILAFEPELDRVLHCDISYVKPGGKKLSLVEIGSAVSRKYPGESIVMYLPSPAPDFPAGVILSRGMVSVNPYTGEVLGVRARGQTFLGVIREFHVRLALGTLGRGILDWCTLALLVSLLSGLYLWWPVKRMRIGGRRWSARFWYDLHSSIGFFSLLPVLLLAATGTVIGFRDQVGRLIVRSSNTKTIENNDATSVPKLERQGAQISPDQAVSLATAQFPGAVPYRVQMPKYGGLYVVALEFAHNRISGKRNFISLDPSSGKIISARLSSALSVPEKFMAINGAIHTGNILGLPSKIVASLACLLLPLQAVSGLLIWLRRKGFLHTR